ncbi:peptidylprolyl isomerase [Archangium lansingense]|uniref:Periplasmic chaperone PpiD n=1 Tax=Archangium lansingense TaxID=2995310 RepID=A0ABT4A4L2_9BACT|nr:SurA N-terminal domain-containing protein [Archangium lansinium]MCY1076568.1 SurA N-terminal domain-containing protein [Archangium lansinium]
MKDALEPRKVVIYLFIIAIAVVFTLQFGPGSSGFGAAPSGAAAAPSAPAVVNGKEIPLMEFRREYVNQLQYLRSQGQPVSEAIARQFGLPQSVLERMVNTELLAQAAERHGVKASDEEVLKILQRDPSFHKDGQFDYGTYQQVLRDYYRQTPADYEEDIRRRLAAQKMLGIVQGGTVVSEDEVRTRFEKEGNQARIVFARFLPSMYAAKVPAPSAADLTAYKQAHEKELKEYYEANRFVYQQPERIRARQILVKLAPDATPEAKAKAMERAQALLKEIEGGKDFGEVAKASSEDPGTKPSGGDLGWVERNNWDPALANAAFALEPGKVTQPIETKFGVHLVKVEEKKPAQDKKLEEVQDEIATNLYKKDKAKELARVEADKALAQVKAGKTITELFPPEKEQPALLRFETETRPEAVQTDTFNAASLNVPHLGPAPELLGAVFTSKGPQALDQAFPVGEGFIIAQVTERQLADDANFAQKKEELRKQAEQAKQYEVADSFLKSLRKSGTVVTNSTVLDQVTGG